MSLPSIPYAAALRLRADLFALEALAQDKLITSYQRVVGPFMRRAQTLSDAILTPEVTLYDVLTDPALAAFLASLERGLMAFAEDATVATLLGDADASTLGVANMVALITGAVQAVARRPNAGAIAAVRAHLEPRTPLADYFARLAPNGVQIARDVFTSALYSGAPRADLLNDLQGRLGLPLSTARTIARTQIIRSYRDASLATMRANSDVVTGWMWAAGYSLRTCDACWAMDGTKHALSDQMDSHLRCRCVMVPITKTYQQLGIDAAEPARDDLRGAAKFETLSAADQRTLLGPAKYALYKSGAIELQDVAYTATSPSWGPVTRSATLGQALENAARRKAALHLGRL